MSSLLFFWHRFKSGTGKWDYKSKGPQRYNPQYDPFGNFVYGATGRALGISPEVLFAEAGHRQTGNPKNSGTKSSRWRAWLGLNPGGTAPFGDDRDDHPWVIEGMRYFDEYMKRRPAP
jgi:hypothetical protein